MDLIERSPHSGSELKRYYTCVVCGKYGLCTGFSLNLNSAELASLFQ